jgi:hypothetical protein
MGVVVPIQFPPGEILDRDGIVWVTLPPETGISQSRILGRCSCDPLDLEIAQVTIDRGDWRLDLLSSEQASPFPVARGFLIAMPGLAQHDVRAWSTEDVPVRVTVRVRRAISGSEARDAGPIAFRLTLLARQADEERAS